jgi:hypothetical protein
MSPFQGVTTIHLFLSSLSVRPSLKTRLPCWARMRLRMIYETVEGTELLKVASVMLHWSYLYEFAKIVQHIFYKKFTLPEFFFLIGAE